ncbi:hypothetical protein P4234_26775 [Pseudomonas aeruginosa]|nr:hypothetical protein [Pseudomonas aeruginosa]
MATCVPKRVISNLTDCKPQLRAERERLVRNIGIETRRMAQEWQCFSTWPSTPPSACWKAWSGSARRSMR